MDNCIEPHVDLQSNFLDEVYVVDENVNHGQAPSGILDSRTRQYLDFVEELDETERGAGGFGSTGV